MADGPHVVGVHHCHGVELVDGGADVGAGDYAPLRTVPVLYKRLVCTTAGVVITHGPHIVGAHHSYCNERAADADIGTGDLRPRRAVPVLYKRYAAAAVDVIANCPHIACAHHRHAVEVVAE